MTTVLQNSSQVSTCVASKYVPSPRRQSDSFACAETGRSFVSLRQRDARGYLASQPLCNRDSNVKTFWFIWQQLITRTTCLSLLLGEFLIFSQATIASAETVVLISEKLPSPPAVNSSDRSKIKPSSFSSGKFREYIFKKPVLSNSNANPVYLVEVYGDSDLILYQVRKFEPQAFRKERSIQVGKFSQQQSADALVKKLNRAGLRSRITLVSG
ncbi:MAG: SPOR domain-containing protein [Xenococcaceae cyanobacterium]